MALRSMTGFGCVEEQSGNLKVTCEMKSINHRYLELTIRGVPDAPTEALIRKLIASRLSRGRLDLCVKLEWLNTSSKQVKVDKALALTYYNNLKELQESLGIPGEIRISDLSILPGVLSASERELEEKREFLLKVVDTCVSRLIEMREREGEATAHDLANSLGKIEVYLRQIEENESRVVQKYRDRVAARIHELCGVDIEQSRLAQEVAILAERSSISEELARLRSHLSQMRLLLGIEAKPVGKKMDFILQEMQREANTIGSKAGDEVIGPIVIEMKCEIEKMREQVQNVE
ncbi:MAG TPA: YicC family protein [Firmicutes bacterium]|nr:YicC family protein [Bacillota bacterium]